MVGLILLVLVVGFSWMVVANASKQRALVARKQELELWEHNVTDEFCSYVYRVHFPTMTYHLDSRLMVWPGRKENTYCRVSRTPNGFWSMQLTEDCYRQEVTRLTAAGAKIAAFKAGTGNIEAAELTAWRSEEGRLAQLLNGNPWDPFPPTLVPQLETAYQRYIHQSH